MFDFSVDFEKLIATIKDGTWYESYLGRIPLNGRFQDQEHKLTDEQVTELFAELDKTPAVRDRIHNLELSDNQLRIVDLSFFRGFLDEVRLNRNRQLAVVIIDTNTPFSVVDLQETNLTMATKIALKRAFEPLLPSIPYTPVYLSTANPLGNEAEPDILQYLELPQLSTQMLEEHFSFIFAQYADVTDLVSKTSSLGTLQKGKFANPDLIVQVLNFLPDRTNELLKLLINNVMMFENAFSRSPDEQLVLLDFLRAKNLTFEVLEKAMASKRPVDRINAILNFRSLTEVTSAQISKAKKPPDL